MTMSEEERNQVLTSDVLALPWPNRITMQGPLPSHVPWKDTGRVAIHVDSDALRYTHPWLLPCVLSEELLLTARKHGLLWDPRRVKFRMIEGAGGHYVEGIHLDHPNFTGEKP